MSAANCRAARRRIKLRYGHKGANRPTKDIKMERPIKSGKKRSTQ